jgi:hypothetical protein
LAFWVCRSLEEVTEPSPLGFAQVLFVAVIAVPANRLRPRYPRQRVNQLPQTGHAILAGMFFSRPHLHVQAQPQPPDPVGVIGVAGASRFVRIVAHLCALLMAVDGLDRGVDIQYPRLIEQRFPSRPQVPLLPASCTDLIESF